MTVATTHVNVAQQVKQATRVEAVKNNPVQLAVRNLNVYYDNNHAVKNVNIRLLKNTVTAFIGPSGCGKSTLLRSLNRMNDTIPGCRVTGEIRIDGVNVNDPTVNPLNLRKYVGMVWQRPNPFHKSIFDNVAYGPKHNGVRHKRHLHEIVETSLKKASLWDEVKDRLHQSALRLSGGQQQRLCIARAIAMEPKIILLDEPASALDPVSTNKIEALIHELKEEYTIAIVTHNMQQAARISDFTAFFLMGELVEMNETERLFTNPEQRETEDYVTGRFG